MAVFCFPLGSRQVKTSIQFFSAAYFSPLFSAIRLLQKSEANFIRWRYGFYFFGGIKKYLSFIEIVTWLFQTFLLSVYVSHLDKKKMTMFRERRFDAAEWGCLIGIWFPTLSYSRQCQWQYFSTCLSSCLPAFHLTPPPPAHTPRPSTQQ